MIVEDEYFLSELMTARFEFMGFEVECVENGQLALDKVEEFHPDIILMDYMMPIMDGMEATYKLKENPETKGIPIIFVTAVSKSEEIEKAKRSGAEDYVTKPFDFDLLTEKIKSLLHSV